MEQTNCHSIKDALINRLAQDIYVGQVRGQCVFTLPFKTLDDRFPAVFVDKKMGGVFLVHDAGMTTSHLFAQGIHLTEARANYFKQIASHLGVGFGDGAFQVLCSDGDLQASILAVSECIILATIEVATIKPVFEEEPVGGIIKRSFALWQQSYFASIDQRVAIKGRKGSHTMDFVAYPAREGVPTVAMKVLAPSYSPQAQAERYGFLVLDTERTIYEQWRRIAVITKVEQWKQATLELVRSLSSRTIELHTGEERELSHLVPSDVGALVEAA